MADSSDKHAACAALAATKPQHEGLARFAGTWRAEVKIWMAPGQPPHISHGTMITRLAMGNKFLVQEYTSDDGMFEGHGLWGYNTTAQRYEGVWIDGMTSMIHFETGQNEGGPDVYRMESRLTDPMTNKPMRKWSLIRYQSATKHSMESFRRYDDGPEMKDMEIHYTRAS